MASKSVQCPQCGHEIISKPKQSFITGSKTYHCEHCHYQGDLPLKTSTRIIYCSITIIVILILLIMVSGGKGSIGILGIIAPIILFRDWQKNKNLRKYWEQHQVPPIPNPKERHPYLKGLAVSALLFIITFGLGAFLYDSEGSTPTNVSGTAPSNNSDNNSETWQSFHSTEGKFTVKFPNYPKSSSSSEKYQKLDLAITLYDSTASNGDEYLAQFVTYPVNPEDLDPKGALEGSVNGSVNSNKNNKLISSSFSKFQNYPAVDYVIQNSGEGIYIKGRNILVGITLYSLIVASKNQNPENYDQFINSFELTQ